MIEQKKVVIAIKDFVFQDNKIRGMIKDIVFSNGVTYVQGQNLIFELENLLQKIKEAKTNINNIQNEVKK